MALGIFIVPYERITLRAGPARRCGMDRYTPQIAADGGEWREAEFLGNRALVKVRASASTLNTIESTENWYRVPNGALTLDTTLGSLTLAQRNAVRNQVLDAGYSQAEIDAAFPNLGAVTIRQALRFLLSRRLKPRYDSGTDTIVCDGSEQACLDLNDVDAVS